jgi:phosphoglycolate phosphatase-like HAD superfamily hydrolase
VILVFDIDGTLTRSVQHDAHAFVQAFQDVFALDASRFTECQQVTDQGITEELFRRRFGRAPSVAEVDQVRRRFLELLGAALPRTRDLQVPGAERLLSRLQRDGYGVSLATGAWRDAARLKLESASIPHEDIPLASSDDYPERERILSLAIERAGGGRALYVGDGPWDVRAAVHLAIPFIGVGTADFASMKDLSDQDLFLSLVRRHEA